MRIDGSTLAPSGAGTLGTVMAWLTSVVARVEAYATYRRDVAILSRMDERLLRDAGLSRYDVKAVRSGAA